MARPTLVIANKNYSSWSMRAWVLLRAFGIAFDEVVLKFGTEAWKRDVRRYSPTGLVPVLLLQEEPVWDTLAIVETVAERWADRAVWPVNARARQVARSVCAEMHAGFRELRSGMPMNIRSRYPGKGMTPGVREDIARITTIWTECRARFGGEDEFLFGAFSAADAFYGPVVTRFATYAVSLPPVCEAYASAIHSHPAVAEWIAAARAETEVVLEDELYANP
jgi:glutathione S-transferase